MCDKLFKFIMNVCYLLFYVCMLRDIMSDLGHFIGIYDIPIPNIIKYYYIFTTCTCKYTLQTNYYFLLFFLLF